MTQMQQSSKPFSKDLTDHFNSLPVDLHKKYPSGILDDLDVRDILKISRRTSLEYRQKGYLRYHRFANDTKIFYLLDELIDDIRNSSN